MQKTVLRVYIFINQSGEAKYKKAWLISDHLMNFSLLTVLFCISIFSLYEANRNRLVSVLYLACQKCDIDTVKSICDGNNSINPYAILDAKWHKSPARVARDGNCAEIVEFFKENTPKRPLPPARKRQKVY